MYSYHEKKKDARVSGYGTLHLRYGKDGVKDFDCCSLSLHPCRNPVVTPSKGKKDLKKLFVLFLLIYFVYVVEFLMSNIFHVRR